MPNPILNSMDQESRSPRLGDRLITGLLSQAGIDPAAVSRGAGQVLDQLRSTVDPTHPQFDPLGIGAWSKVLSIPGDYFRGAMSGQPGERVTPGQALTKAGWTHPGDPLAGPKEFGYGLLTDPMTLLPLAGEMKLPSQAATKEFLAGESGALDWRKVAEGLTGAERERFLSSSPEKYFEARGHALSDLPASQVEDLGKKLGVNVEFLTDPEVYQAAMLVPGSPLPQAFYATRRAYSAPTPRTVYLPASQPIWSDPNVMKSEVRRLGTSAEAGVPPFYATTDPFHIGTHELVHALHDRALEAAGINKAARSFPMSEADRFLLQKIVSGYSARNPSEAVAEIGTKGLLGSRAGMTPGPRPLLPAQWSSYHGPKLDEMWDALREVRPDLGPKKAGGYLGTGQRYEALQEKVGAMSEAELEKFRRKYPNVTRQALGLPAPLR